MRISDWSSDVCSSDLVLLHDVAVGLVAVGAEAEARLLQRVADIEVGPAKLVIVKLEPEAEQAVDDDAVVGDDAVEIGLRLARQVGFERRLLERLARAPLVADARGGDDAELAVGKLDRRAAGDARRPVDRDMVVPLEQARLRIDQLHLDRLQEIGRASCRDSVWRYV